MTEYHKIGMSNSSATGKILSLRLEAGGWRNSDKFQLHRPRSGHLGHVVITTFETKRAVTLVCNNLHIDGRSKKLDLLEALKSGLIELVQSGKEDVIALPLSTGRKLD